MPVNLSAQGTDLWHDTIPAPENIDDCDARSVSDGAQLILDNTVYLRRGIVSPIGGVGSVAVPDIAAMAIVDCPIAGSPVITVESLATVQLRAQCEALEIADDYELAIVLVRDGETVHVGQACKHTGPGAGVSLALAMFSGVEAGEYTIRLRVRADAHTSKEYSVTLSGTGIGAVVTSEVPT